MELVFTDDVDILSVFIALTPQTAKVARGFFSLSQTVSELTDITVNQLNQLNQLKFVILIFVLAIFLGGRGQVFYLIFMPGISGFRKLAIKMVSLGFLWKFPLVL